MPAKLRERKTRPYKTTIELPGDFEENTPQMAALEDDVASSESAFEMADDDNDNDKNDYPLDEADFDIEMEDTSIEYDNQNAASSQVEGGATKGNSKTTVPSGARSSTLVSGPGLSRPLVRQNTAVPFYSHNHRHRGAPVYFSSARTLRLLTEPNIFGPNEAIWTRSCGEQVIRNRLSKAVGTNIGEGPIWELIEDRSWFKEYTSEQLRPIAYTALQDENATIISPELASPYLPRDITGSISPCVTCFLGPRQNQSKVIMEPLQSVRMDEFFSESRSHVFFAGAPVWAIDWCPFSEEGIINRNYKQYLAVAPFPTQDHSPEIGQKCSRPSPACLQIWSLAPSDPKTTDLHDPGTMKCEMVLCIDGGPAHDLKWCPLPAHDECDEHHPSDWHKLGILAGAFEDGSISFYVVPVPGQRDAFLETSDPLYVRIMPRLRLELEETVCWCIDWANSDLVAVGCTNGSVAIYHVGEALENPSSTQALRPSHYIPLHQSAVRSVCWAKIPTMAPSGEWQDHCDPSIVFSGGYDGILMVTDLRDLRGNVMSRTRDVINSVVFSHWVGGPLTSDSENTIKNFGLTPTTLGRGHGLLEPSGSVWSISTSDFHPQVAVGSADGTCQTTNILKSTRKGGSAPFFIHKIYQLDYSRNTDEFRMLEQFLPYEHQDRPSAGRTTTKKKDKATYMLNSLPIITGGWSPEIGVTRVAWHSGSGMARSPLLASSTASGICRVDWLLGRFPSERFPYTGVAALRGEVKGIDYEEVEDDD